MTMPQATRTPRSPQQRIRDSYRWKQLAASFKATCQKYNLPCHICRQPIDYQARRGPSAFEADHNQPLARRPDLAYCTSNLRPSHASCNNMKGDSLTVGQGQWTAADW
jgi:5-methylcytosine-specific restriction endonuclease McrA